MVTPILKRKTFSQIKASLRKSSRPTIALYLDMDGVFADFSKRTKELFPRFEEMEGLYRDEMSSPDKKLLWSGMVKAIKSDSTFWANLDWCKGGKELFNFIKKNKARFDSISFVTSPILSDPNCIPGKQEWIMNNFKGIPLDAFYAETDKYKCIGLQQGDIQLLIDDRKKNCDLWSGHTDSASSILHVSSSDTIKRLKELL